MADIPNEEELDKLRENGGEYLDIIRQQAAAMKDLAKALKGNTDEQALANLETSKAVNLSRKLSTFTKESLKDGRSRRSFEKAYTDLKAEQVALEKRIEREIKRGTVASIKRAKILNDHLDITKQTVAEAFKLTEAYKTLDKKVKFFDDLSNLVQDIPLLNKLFPELKKAAEAARDAAIENKKSWDAFKEYGNAFTKVVAVFTGGLVKKGLQQVDKQIMTLNRSLNMTTEQSRLFYRNLQTSKTFTSDQLIKSVISLNKELGTASNLTIEQSETLTTLTERLGLSASSANNLFGFAAATGKEFKDYATNLIGTVKIQNVLSKKSIDYKAVMEDVAQAGAATRLSLQRFPGGIVKAAYEARKLGLNLSQLEKSAGGLLDFERSIEAELEAELLTGKEFNLERARALALTNDLAGLSEELAKQGITQADFSRANRLEQTAMAEMIGMSRDEMAQMFEKQAAIEKVSKEDLNTKQKLALLQQQGLSLSEAAAAVGEDEYNLQKERMTMQERINVLQDKLLGLAERFYPIIDGIGWIIEKMTNNAQILYKVLLAITMLRLGRGIALMSKNLSSAIPKAQALQKATSAAMTNSAGQSLVKSASSPTGFRNAAGQFAKAPAAATTAASTGGNIFTRLLDASKTTVGNLVSKLNPSEGILKQAGGWMSKNLSKVLKLPIISSVLEGIFAKGDIEAMVATATNKEDLYQQVGKRSWEALGGIGGALIGGGLGSLIPIPGVGTALGALGGDLLGRWFTGWLADELGAKGMGKTVLNMFPDAKKSANAANPELGLATGGIITQPTRALVGEAGAEAVVPLKEFYAKFDELISTVKQGGNVYMDSMAVGHSTALSTSRLG